MMNLTWMLRTLWSCKQSGFPFRKMADKEIKFMGLLLLLTNIQQKVNMLFKLWLLQLDHHHPLLVVLLVQ
uniref:Uncharacterized protein n=1 Tax=Rhizophora mucronata TaxID=61149 RepID=A0A2P2IWZ5_RHIMU